MRRRTAIIGISWRRGAALVAVLALVALSGCGRADAVTVVEGQLRAGDLDYWLVGTTLVAIGEARIGGEPSKLGSRVRAEGRGREDGVFAATKITVGAAESLPASLPAAKANGAVESLDPATGRGRIAGWVVQFAPGVPGAANLAVGNRVAIEGYALPDGTLLVAAVIPAQATPTAAPSAPAATATRRRRRRRRRPPPHQRPSRPKSRASRSPRSGATPTMPTTIEPVG